MVLLLLLEVKAKRQLDQSKYSRSVPPEWPGGDTTAVMKNKRNSTYFIVYAWLCVLNY